MKKQKERAIPYRVYKKMFSDCPAHDYKDGKIVVEFPDDYINSKMYTPEGWYRGGNYVSKQIGRTSYGYAVSVDVAEHSDGGCKYYDVCVSVGNTFLGGTQKTKEFFRSFDSAIEWGVQTAESFVSN